MAGRGRLRGRDRPGRHRDGQAVGALQEAVELYGGDLLQSGYDEWLLEERERLRRRYLEALERLTGKSL